MAQTVPEYDVVIIGAGVVGSSCAMGLSKAGKKVLLLEQYELLGHGRGSSHGGARRIGLLDLAPGIRVRRAWDAWLDLQANFPQKRLFDLTGEVIITKLFPHGLLILPFFAMWALAKKAVGHSLPFTMELLLSKKQVEEKFPKCFRFGWNTAGLYVEEAAVLHTHAILELMQEKAEDYGAELRANAKVNSVEVNEDMAVVHTSQGAVTCKNLVVAAGGWSGELLKTMGVAARTQIQTWSCPNFDLGDVKGLTVEDKCPQFNFLDQGMYGFPCSNSLPKLTIRQVVTSDDGNDPHYNEKNDDHVAVIQGLLERHLPEINRQPNQVYTCRYPQLILNEEVGKQQILDFVPGTNKRVVLASGMDGYGFKYGPLYGEEVLDLLQGSPGPAGMEWDRKPAENLLLRVLHKTIDRLIDVKFTDVVFFFILVSCWFLISSCMTTCGMPTRQSQLFTFSSLIYGPVSEQVFRRPQTIADLIVVAKVWLIHFLLVCGAAPLVAHFLLGVSFSASWLAHVFNLAALVLRYSAMSQAGRAYDRTLMGQFLHERTTRLMTGGVYGWVRHPGFSAHILQALAIALFFTGGSMLSFSLQAVVAFVIFNMSGAAEEKVLLDDADMAIEYKEYMEQTPNRLIPIPAEWLDWDLFDVGYSIVAACQLKRVKMLKKWDIDAFRKMYQSTDKGNFLETAHAQGGWLPIKSVESAAGADWKALREALIPVLKNTNWESRLTDVVQRNLPKSKQGLDFAELNRVLARIFYTLHTDKLLPEEELDMILAGVQEWRLHLSGKGIGNHEKKLRVLNFMRTAIGEIEGHPLDETDIFTMSAIMQPLFVSPIINVPDAFTVAERQLHSMDAESREKILSDEENCHMFLKECLRCSHPFPIVERNVKGGIFGSYHVVGRYDLISSNGPEFDCERWRGTRVLPPFSGKCPFEPMLFGTGPRRCQGSLLAIKLMTLLLQHFAADIESFKPSQGHNTSGRNNDNNTTLKEELYKISVIPLVIWRTSLICAPLRMLKNKIFK